MSIEIVTGAAAQANVASMPASVLVYGGPGMYKTTDAVTAFVRAGRCNAFVIPCEDGGIKSPAALGLPVPDHVRTTVKSWAAMQETVAWIANNRQNYTGVILDGLSTLTNNLYKEAQEQFKGSKNKYDIPVAVRNCLISLREWFRQLGLHCVLLAHALAPGVIEGVFYQGSPLLQPKSMIENYYGLIDTVLRVDYVMPVVPPGAALQPNAQLPLPTRVYFTGGTGTWPEQFVQPNDWRYWRTKNREGCNDPIIPADLGAFLRYRRPPYVGL